MGLSFDETVLGVPGGERRIGPAAGLAAAQAGDPACGARERFIQGTYLADVAAGFAGLDGLAEAEHAIARDEVFDFFCVGRDKADLEAVAQFARFDRFQRLWKVPAGVEREHVEVLAPWPRWR